ncbi:MAG TPA: lytic transglycosylase domain-containing protein [Rhizobiaceae bacterium]|nr:lytic transglycosylase domain-containing protein [Rhizobiaceae bacterium]
MRAVLAAAVIVVFVSSALADPPGRNRPITIHRICDLIETNAKQYALPEAFFARLIWKESRFDPNAVSPAGAEGIAQFMPGTAALRGLEDSFDVEQAISASAEYLRELKDDYGNLGLAAAAYNAGEARVSRWLDRGGFLPLETESYVLDIMGEAPESFSDRAYAGVIRPLDEKKSFDDACRAMPVVDFETVAMANVHLKPWGIQVAGNFRRSAAIKQWQRVKGRYGVLLADYEPVVSRVRTPIGRRGVYAVRIGIDNRANADILCQQLRGAGGACVVMRNW